ncbi:MAG: C-GCAxxG-C-C family protein [Hungatella sp.]|jgi:C_GCAxxG_C_C family probable redox protein|nr:C-GCAxxG-C-C family protein [Hungatella sp.]
MGTYERQHITFEEIRELFLKGIDCSQVVVGAFAEELGADRQMLRKVSACFGGGMQCGETCGAVSGALMVLGMKYGHSEEGDTGQKQVMKQKTGEFKRLFGEKYPSCICRDLLGHDISRKEELENVMEKGLLLQFCPKVVEDTIEILGKIL